jgi:diguanylate cyclase (GGDEF)-like protein
LKNWQHKLAHIQEWSMVERGFVPVAVLALFYIQYMVWCLFEYLQPIESRIVHVQMLPLKIGMDSAIVIGALALLVLGLRLRHTRPDDVWYQHLTANFFGLSLCVGGYMTGTLTFAAGVELMGAPLVGFIFMERQVVFGAFAVSFATVLGLNLASAYGVLPYAPLMIAPNDPATALMWTNVHFFFAAPHLLVSIVLMTLVIGRWRQREAEIHALGLTDALTGLHNRRSILDLVDKEVARTRRHGPPLAVALLDLDHFKRINDTWGHPMGDRVLKEAANVLAAQIRQTDAVGRFGGEEFLLLLPDTTCEGAIRSVERCREHLAALSIADEHGQRVPVTGSFGIACNQGHYDLDAGLLIRLADEALYRAKARGRNRLEMAALPDPMTPGAEVEAVASHEAARPVRVARALTNPWGEPIAFWQRWLSNLLEWSEMAKTALVMALTVVMGCGVLLGLWVLWLQDDLAGKVNMTVCEGMMELTAAMILVGVVLLLLSLYMHRRGRHSRLLQLLALQCYGMSMIVDAYYLGILYMPTGLMLIGSPLLGLILFSRRIVFFVFGTSLTAVVGLAYASAWGVLPYAPLLQGGDYLGYQQYELFWVISNYAFISPVLAVVFMLATLVLGRWREREAAALHLTLTDMLTAVHNRRSIMALLDKEVARTRRYGPPLAVVLLDLDHFKRINDTWGHDVGDRVLRESARALKASIRQCDSLGRYGGEEFLLLLQDTTAEGALVLAERCREALAALQLKADNGEPVPVSASFGVVCNEGNLELESRQLIHAADEALYRAKQRGRNRVESGDTPVADGEAVLV